MCIRDRDPILTETALHRHTRQYKSMPQWLIRRQPNGGMFEFRLAGYRVGHRVYNCVDTRGVGVSLAPVNGREYVSRQYIAGNHGAPEHATPAAFDPHQPARLDTEC